MQKYFFLKKNENFNFGFFYLDLPWSVFFVLEFWRQSLSRNRFAATESRTPFYKKQKSFWNKIDYSKMLQLQAFNLIEKRKIVF